MFIRRGSARREKRARGERSFNELGMHNLEKGKLKIAIQYNDIEDLVANSALPLWVFANCVVAKVTNVPILFVWHEM